MREVKEDISDSKGTATARADGCRVTSHKVTVGDAGVAQAEASKCCFPPTVNGVYYRFASPEKTAIKHSAEQRGLGNNRRLEWERARESTRSLPGMPPRPWTQQNSTELDRFFPRDKRRNSHSWIFLATGCEGVSDCRKVMALRDSEEITKEEEG